MAGYSELQEAEFAAQSEGFTAVAESTETAQFH